MEKTKGNQIMAKLGRMLPLMVVSAMLLSACGGETTSTSPTATVNSAAEGAATAATSVGTVGTGVMEGVATNVAGTFGGSLLTLEMGAQNNSGQDGKATLTDMGNGKIKAVLDLDNGTAESQPAHIHKGSCATLDPNPLIPLNNVVNGKSETEIEVSMATLTSGHAINVHKSAAEAAVYVSCADIEGTPGMMEGTPGAMMESTPMMQGTVTP